MTQYKKVGYHLGLYNSAGDQISSLEWLRRRMGDVHQLALRYYLAKVFWGDR